ncbi:ribonuclease HI [Roseiconus nitratireducens]|uniref:ribonuclease HI n=1 Tax=Roseiconus nitratireducens TaxID=2605748 RepID=UPI00191C1947|nr:ribonuclease HI [Roseiconus nitratireducens]
MKLSFPLDPVGPSLMTHNRALHNPPIAVPRAGLPSHRPGPIATDYLLVCEAHSTTLDDGRWRFTLEAADGELILDAEDHDYGDLNRLTLLAAVRGLESLEGACGVTLLSNNRYLIRSLSNSLPRWRQNNFMWEHFGRRIDVQHADLWRRVDHALAIHRVQACLVSSCLVSNGQADADGGSAAKPVADQSACYRVDQPHGSGAGGPKAGGHVPSPSDRLRRLLLGRQSTPRPESIPRRRGRFTAEDLESL